MTIIIFVWFNLVYFLINNCIMGCPISCMLKRFDFFSPEAIKAFFFPKISFSGFHYDLCLPSEGYIFKPPVTAKDLCEGGMPNYFQVPPWPLSAGCAAAGQTKSVET